MKRWIWLIALPLGALSLLAGNARGGGTKVGAQQGFDCTITFDESSMQYTASGAFGTVRSEPTALKEKSIGCYVDSIPARGSTPAHSLVLCQAVSEDGQLMCASDDSVLVATVASMNADAYITFTTGSQVSTESLAPPCTHIRVENNSKYNVKSQ